MTLPNDQTEGVENPTGGATPPQPGSDGNTPPSGVKTDVDIPTHDKDGVPYYNRYREYEEKYKGVDLEKYKQLQDVDPEEYRGLKAFAEAIETNPELEEAVNRVIDEFKAGRLKKSDAEGVLPKTGETQTQYERRIEALEARIYENDLKDALNQFDSGFEAQVKEMDLSAREKTILKREIEDAYIADSKSRTPKLTLSDLPRLTKEKYGEIEAYRKELLAKVGKTARDGSPAPLKGGATPTGDKPYNPSDRHARIEAMREELSSKLE